MDIHAKKAAQRYIDKIYPLKDNTSIELLNEVKLLRENARKDFLAGIKFLFNKLNK